MSNKPPPAEVKLNALDDYLKRNNLVIVRHPERRGEWPPVIEARKSKNEPFTGGLEMQRCNSRHERREDSLTSFK